jgi:hypothetical protein
LVLVVELVELVEPEVMVVRLRRLLHNLAKISLLLKAAHRVAVAALL